MADAVGRRLDDDWPWFRHVSPGDLAPIDAAERIIPVDGSRHLVVERGGNRIFTPANVADDLRRHSVGDDVTVVGNRNTN